MSDVYPLCIDLSSYTEIEFKVGMHFVRVEPEHLLECLSWLFCDIDATSERQRAVETCHLNKTGSPSIFDIRRCDNCGNLAVYDSKHEPIFCPYCGARVVDE